MPETGEKVANSFKISRVDQNLFLYNSQMRGKRGRQGFSAGCGIWISRGPFMPQCSREPDTGGVFVSGSRLDYLYFDEVTDRTIVRQTVGCEIDVNPRLTFGIIQS
jgi:hypothetical protein